MRKVETHFEKVSSWLNCLCALGSRSTNATFFYTCYWISIEAELARFFLKSVNMKVGAVLPCVVMVTGSYVSCPVFEISLHYNGPALARTTVASRALKKMYTILLWWIEFLVILSCSGCDLWSNYLVIQYEFYSSHFIILMLIWTIFRSRLTSPVRWTVLNCWNNLNIHRGHGLCRCCCTTLLRYSIAFAKSWLRCDYFTLLAFQNVWKALYNWTGLHLNEVMGKCLVFNWSKGMTAWSAHNHLFIQGNYFDWYQCSLQLFLFDKFVSHLFIRIRIEVTLTFASREM